jgi:hypothetical protein
LQGDGNVSKRPGPYAQHGLPGATFLGEGTAAPRPAESLLQQIHFESKLWPNLHHFLYVLARARNGAPDRFRVAVRAAPLDTEGFGALPAGDRKTWDEALEAYQTNAAPLDISYGKLVDVNYAVADLAATTRMDEATDIPNEIRGALAKAGPVYQALWWPRHDAANQEWVSRLRPQIERYGPQIVKQLTAAFQHAWPTAPIRVEVVAYAQWAGAYTTSDPPLIAISSLDEQHQGSDGLEQFFHECSHLMMDTVDASLGSHARVTGKEVPREVSHMILFYTVGETLRRIVPGHTPYAAHYGVWQRFPAKYYELISRYWQPYLDGSLTMEQAIDQIVRGL